MKYSPETFERFLEDPDGRIDAILLFGTDATAIAERRQALVGALLGRADDPFLLRRYGPAELRADPALCADARHAVPMTPGRPVVLLESIGEADHEAIRNAFKAGGAGSAFLIATSGVLRANGTIRTLFEKAPNAAALNCFDEPASARWIRDALMQAGAAPISDSAMGALCALGEEEDKGVMRQLIGKLALYGGESDAMLTEEDVEACAPAVTGAAVDGLTEAIAFGRTDKLPALCARLRGQGISHAAMLARVNYYMNNLAAAKAGEAAPGGVERALSRMRPPLFGRRRAAFRAQCHQWRADQLAAAISELHNAELRLRRGGATPPEAGFVERAFLRASMLAQR